MVLAQGVKCTRETLCNVIQDIDPTDVALHWNAKIHRRAYLANSLWDIGILLIFVQAIILYK